MMAHTRTGTHTPLTPLIAQEPPLMDASKWNCQIIHCLNALASLSSSLPPYPSQASLAHFNLGFHLFSSPTGPSPPPGSPAREEHLRNQKCRHTRNTYPRRPRLRGQGNGGRAREEEEEKVPSSVPTPDISSGAVAGVYVCILTSRCLAVRRSNGSESERARKTPSEKGTL